MDFMEILALLGNSSNMKTEVLPSGTIYIGRPDPDRGKGFFHRIYAPTSKSVLERFADANALMSKFRYWSDLHRYNGFNLFYQSMLLYGVHGGQSSSLDLPFDILAANVESWGKLSGPETLLIGGAEFGTRSVRYVEHLDARILAIENDMRVSFEWRLLDDFVMSEISRLSSFFSADGELTSNLEVSRFGRGSRST